MTARLHIARSRPAIRLAGQITGCEGYVESPAIGLLAGRFAAAERADTAPVLPPAETALGALRGPSPGTAEAASFQPKIPSCQRRLASPSLKLKHP